jgi:hypothetical protein
MRSFWAYRRMQRKCSTKQRIRAVVSRQILLRISLLRQKEFDQPKKKVHITRKKIQILALHNVCQAESCCERGLLQPMSYRVVIVFCSKCAAILFGTKLEKKRCALPRIEKKIMKPADICTTLRLPTCVKASKPAFSLQMS